MANKVEVKIGDRFFNKVCGWYEIVELINNQKVSVKFDNTGNIVKCSKYHCVNGEVSDKDCSYYRQVGEIYENCYGKYEIVEILKNKRAKIKFLDTGTIIEATINNIKNRNVKDHFRPIIYGVAYIGIRKGQRGALSKTKAYTVWRNMLERCYNEDKLKKYPTYQDCYVCEEWKCFAIFEEWYNDNLIEGFFLDKDILLKGNKEYCPNKCCFVPNEINCLLTKRQNKRGELPIGVGYSESKNRYKSSFTRGTEKVFLGYYATIKEAFNAYKQAKESWIKEVANKWKDKIKPNVYKALMNYEVEITD